MIMLSLSRRAATAWVSNRGLLTRPISTTVRWMSAAPEKTEEEKAAIKAAREARKIEKERLKAEKKAKKEAQRLAQEAANRIDDVVYLSVDDEESYARMGDVSSYFDLFVCGRTLLNTA